MKTSLLITIALSLLLVGCSQERVVDVIQERNDGLFYVGNEEKPFTGQGSAYWDAEKTKKKAEANYKNGKRHGLRTGWYENGQKKFEWNHKNGESHGLETGWYENGQKEYEWNWKDGKRVEKLCCD